MSRSPWLHNPRIEATFVLAPPFVATVVSIVLMQSLGTAPGVSALAWLLLIVGIDVAHVWATLYRTYLRDDARRRQRNLLLTAPLVAWILGAVLYSLGPGVFWRALAYVAVFHFVRQQYGILRMYYRHERDVPKRVHLVRSAAIYLATLWPLTYWHTHPRAFDWFIPGDFVFSDAAWLSDIAWISDVVGVAYLIVLFAHAAQELSTWRQSGRFNVPANLVLGGTALSWWVGIVLYDADLIFTLTNVASHGVPYIALVWLDHRRSTAPGPLLAITRKHVIAFVGLLLLLAVVEEGLWDRLHWRSHDELFGWLSFISQVNGAAELAWLVPLLSLPQTTHYILDGFIWKLRGDQGAWARAAK
jgi:hypothetical protein